MMNIIKSLLLGNIDALFIAETLENNILHSVH